MTMSTRGPPDGGWSWVVLVCSCLTSLLVFGNTKCNGLLYNELPKLFNIDRSTAAGITSLAGCLSLFMGPITGVLTNYFSCRQIIMVSGLLCFSGYMTCFLAPNPLVFLIGFGILFGIGAGLSIVPSRLIVTQYFMKKRTLAVGLSLTGGCWGGIVIPPLVEFFIMEYGLQRAMFLISAILLNVLVCGMTFKPLRKRPQSTKTHLTTISQVVSSEDIVESHNHHTTNAIPASKHQMSIPNGDKAQVNGQTESSQPKSHPSAVLCKNLSVLRNVRFLVIAFTACGPLLCHTGFSISVPEYAQSESVEPVSSSMAAVLLSCMSIGDLFGRLGNTWIINKQYVRMKHSFVITVLVSSAIVFAFPYMKRYYEQVTLMVLFGFTSGASLLIPTFLINDYLPQNQLAAAYGFTSMIVGFPVLGIGPLIGTLREQTGSYDLGYKVMALIGTTAAIPWLLESLIGRFSKQGIYRVTSEGNAHCDAMRHSISV